MLVARSLPVGTPRQDRPEAAQAKDKPSAAPGVPPATTIVPTDAPAFRHAPPVSGSRPSPAFVAHLMATAGHFPETRILRRASEADAQAAYGAALRRNEGRLLSTQSSLRTV
jgi:hypothetical protein